MIQQLRLRFLTMRLNAQRFNINNFPKTLKSLEINNPTKEQINKDFKKVLRFNSHPVFQHINKKDNYFKGSNI